MRFQIDLKIFIFAIIFYLTKQIQIYAMIMIFAMIHELGHLLAGILLGMKVEKIQVKPFGFSISFKLKPGDYNKKIKKGNILELKKIIVALAGPITNILIIMITVNLNLGIFEEIMVIYTNILIALFNIIPIYPLDGGRILKGLLHFKFGKQKASKYINCISFYTVIFLTAVAGISILYLKNIAIFIAICVLWTLFLIENKKYRTKEKIYKVIEENQLEKNYNGSKVKVGEK